MQFSFKHIGHSHSTREDRKDRKSRNIYRGFHIYDILAVTREAYNPVGNEPSMLTARLEHPKKSRIVQSREPNSFVATTKPFKEEALVARPQGPEACLGRIAQGRGGHGPNPCVPVDSGPSSLSGVSSTMTRLRFNEDGLPPSPPSTIEDQAWTNRRASAQALRAAQARQVSGRRRFVDPTTCEREYSIAETEFMMAMQEYKKRSGRMFPTWSEVLEVLHSLGYEKLAESTSS